MSSPIREQYPWTSSPLIANAAMGDFAGPALATAVSRAGGIGFIGTIIDMKLLDQQLDSAKTLLEDDNSKTAHASSLPIGVGFLLFVAPLDEAIAVIGRHFPAIVWLACPTQEGDFKIWTDAVRKASPDTKIWIQVASVSIALRVAETCSPDILIMQGSDAGGHGPFPGAGIVSLVPETRDALDRKGFSKIGIFAAGGISDGRGVAAALACGADGVVMGTRFLASSEVDMHAESYREALLKTSDGGVSTARSTVFDQLKGKSIWPSQYDGRAIAGSSYKDFKSGTSIAEVQSRYTQASKEAHRGYGDEVRAAVWAGTGVGLVRELKPAGEIVKECRDSARLFLDRAIKLL